MATESSQEAVAIARDASYVHGRYRSFEFASFEARGGRVLALVAAGAAPVRDALLAIGGLVRPTSGSLAVLGVELGAGAALPGDGSLAGRARSLLRSARRERLPRGAVGLGVVTGLFGVPSEITVGACVRRELSLRTVRREGASASDAATLDHLAAFGLATHVDRTVSGLDADARARLSAALAFAGAPRVACIDLSDPFCCGLSLDQARALISDLHGIAARRGTACIVGVTDPEAARAADERCALDMNSAEALACEAGEASILGIDHEEVAAHGDAAR